MYNSAYLALTGGFLFYLRNELPSLQAPETTSVKLKVNRTNLGHSKQLQW
jgi:hypothetical protein